MWFWGSHGEFVDRARSLPPPGPHGLSTYDPLGFELVGEIYAGTHPSLRNDVMDAPAVACRAARRDAASSEHGGVEISLELRNSGLSDAVVSWIDSAGAAHSYGVLAAGARRVQRSYAGHVWQVAYEVEEGGDHGEVRRYRAGKAPRQIVEAEA